MSKSVVDESKISTIALGAEIVGEITASGSFRVEGKIKGNVTISGKLVVVDTGVIEGDVTCNSALVSGKLDGKIIVEELLQLNPTARIHGDIVTSKIKIEEGAIFTGTCNMDTKELLSQANQTTQYQQQ
ncbi:MAG: polymer-forming cytoskeletal protein [Bacteroidales bacterium]|jgi:cytoskeletal protein CcmA (bactofilin family)|nr:polymer-forming cytoskeletal protein [Bacteroidales bacterium]